MHGSKVLIITTGHHEYDGRLLRHKQELLRSGFDTSIEVVATSSRASRFLMGPFLAYKKIILNQTDCVILPDPELQLFLPPLICKKLAVVSDVHENYQKVIFDRRWIRLGFRNVIRIVTKILEFIRDRWSHVVISVDSSIASKDSFTVTNCPNPIDLPEPIESEALLRLVYVGDIRESRGLSSMLELIKETPEVGLDLVGPCNDIDLENLLCSMDLSDRVVWHGRKPYNESWEIASRCLAGLSLLSMTPSFETAKPTKIWEYWAVGLPVLASDLPGQRMMIDESSGGVVGSLEEIKKALMLWVAEPVAAREIGIKGRQYLEQIFREENKTLQYAIHEAMRRFKANRNHF